MDYELLMSKALIAIKEKVEFNKPFEAKHLFDGIEWESLSKGDRISFGKYFANAIKDNRVTNVKRIERGKDNHARYIKIMEDEE